MSSPTFFDWLLSRPAQDDMVDDLRQDLSRDQDPPGDWAQLIGRLPRHCLEALAEARLEYMLAYRPGISRREAEREICREFELRLGERFEPLGWLVDDELPFTANPQKKDPLGRGDSGGRSMQGEL